MGMLAVNASSHENKVGLLGELSLRTKRLVAGVALLTTVVAGGATAVAIAGGRHGTEPRQEPGASAPAVPGGEQSASPSESETSSGDTNGYATETPYYESISSSPLYQELSADQKAKIDGYDRLSPELFAELPEEDRIAYGLFYDDVYSAYGVELLEKQTTNTVSYRPPEQPISKESSGGDILKDYSTKRATLLMSMMINGDPYKLDESKRDNVLNALSLIYFKPEIHAGTVEKVENIESFVADDNIYNGNDYSPDIADTESPLIDHGGKAYKYVNVTRANGGMDQYLFYYRDVTDIEGKERSIWQLNTVVNHDLVQNIEDLQ
jgi:hypothetical protein